MASPPFQVEDQTDEDFFDKLVDDGFGVAESDQGLVEGDDSDELKAFSNLSIGEVGNTLEDSGGESVVGAKGENNCGENAASSSDAAPNKKVSLVSANSLAFDGVIESSDTNTGADVASDSSTSKSNGSGSAGVKEVQWSSFNTDSAQHSCGGFGSYSDFFSELEDSSVDPFPTVGDSLKAVSNFTPSIAENPTAYSVDPFQTVEDSPKAVSNFTHSVAEYPTAYSVYPFQAVGDSPKAISNYTSIVAENPTADLSAAFGSVEHQEGQAYGTSVEQTKGGEDLNSIQYWESLYPGWRYDPNTGEWHQLEGYDAMENTQGSLDVAAQSASDGMVSEQRSEVSYLQQSAQSIVGTVNENCTSTSISDWNQVSQGNTEYPAHMVFDPQYPGWYYDTIAQEWRLLESYTPDVHLSSTATDQQNQNGYASISGFTPEKESSQYGEYGKFQNYGSQALGSQDQRHDWAGSLYNYNQQSMNMWQPETVGKAEAITSFTENQQFGSLYGSRESINHYEDKLAGSNPMGTVSSYWLTSQSYPSNSRAAGLQSFVPAENYSPQDNQSKREQNQQMNLSRDYYGSQKSTNFSQQQFQSGTQFSYATNEGRSSAGRPPHALVTFGFGGKLIVMKDNNSFLTNSAYGSQDSSGNSISVLNLIEVVDKSDFSSNDVGACDYFRSLCHQTFHGPLIGGSFGSKELNKWIDERIANCESPNMDYRKGVLLRLLLSLLKIASQHYGKLRSPFGTDPALRENDCPELAVAKLFASVKSNGAQLTEFGALTHCLWNLPSEGQIRASAVEVQNLLVSGRKKEALQCAQEGQLWGPALVLASQLGDQFYVDTVKQMALRQLVAGSPLRTLCLLIAGQPADVFAVDTAIDSFLPGAVNISQQPVQTGSNGMLDDWEENLAIITANRTKDDELVIIHLGDCLWKERAEILAAHICYLVAEANFEPYSDSARLCLIGADHWKFPRTYASPEAIQRTELYEHSKVLGNSQYTLLPFQPYKLIYAYMLLEVGKIADSLKYCQAVLKSLKTGRAPEVDIWKQMASSLEERIRTHQQGGNLAPAKLVGKLLTFFDNTVRSVGAPPPPPVVSTSQSTVQSNELDQRQMGPRVTNSQSTMAMSSLVPSASMEPISGFAGDSNRVTKHNRSVSEPDFGRSPKQREAASSEAQSKASISSVPSRFGRISSQLLQKTVGLVIRSRGDKQAKLGEKNKFYYDEKLKRWVEEGAEPPAEEAALPPPPTTAAAFQNGLSNYNIKSAFKSESASANEEPDIKSPSPSERSSGIPPIPPGSNQFSSRGRMGVRSRYVDTFNKGSVTPANVFQSPSIPAVKPGAGANAKFFIPTPAATAEQKVDASYGNSMQEATPSNEDPSTSISNDSFSSSPLSTQMTMQRFPSMDNIPKKGMGAMASGSDSLSSRSRRTASWSGSFSDAFNNPKTTEIKPSGEVLGMSSSSSSSSFMPSEPSSMRLPMNGGNFGDDLHEVEL